MNIKPMAYIRSDLYDRYTYDPACPLVFRWRTQSDNNRAVIGDIAGHWLVAPPPRRRLIPTSASRSTPLARAVWVYVNGTEPPAYLRPKVESPEDYRIENLEVRPPPRKYTPEERKAQNLLSFRAFRDRHTPEEWTLRAIRHSLETNYGITLEDYDRLFAAQNGLCAICKQPEKQKRLSVDHCHNGTGIRGLLCCNCNNGIGRFGDDPKRLRAAAAYLDRHAARPMQLVIRPRKDRSRPTSRSTSGHKWIYWHAVNQKWGAYIRRGKRNVYLGVYMRIEDAIAARDAAILAAA